MINKMLSVKEKILRDVSRDDTISLRRPELEVKEVFNQQTSKKRELLVEVTCRLTKKRSRKVKEM